MIFTYFSDCQSPLPPGASDIIEKMKDVYRDVFSDDETSMTVTSTKYKENITPNIQTSCDFRHDPFMSVDQQASPSMLPSHTEYSLNISSVLTTLDTSTLISDLSPFPQPITPAVENKEQTPMPSPEKKHATCNDVFCPHHEDDNYYGCLSVGTTASSCQTSPAPAFKCRGKKRIRHYDNWTEIKRKRLKNEGKAHISKKGLSVLQKTMRTPCACRYKCNTKLTIEERIDAFEKFWKLGDRERQWLHVANYVTKHNKKRAVQKEVKHNRQYTYKYYLPSKKSKVEVCKIMFLNTYSITDRLVRTALEKYDGSTSIGKDMRGKHSSHKQIINDEMITSVCAHVNSFAPVESHYTRAASKRLYLDGSLSIARMFNFYKEWPERNKYSSQALTLRQYRDIVNTHFNLSFHLPKKDTCDQCHSFKQNENPSNELRVQYEKHQDSKKISRSLKSKDKIDAINSKGRIVCATFDFQKVLSCPHGQMSVLYYKRKLSCYNFTVYNMAEKQGYCYMWDENVAKRGANEVASCLYNFIRQFASKGAKEFRFWSDNCAGQNRNRIVFYMYSYAAKEFDVTITHRFLEKGHTQNEGDSVHSVIERAAENKNIYTPEEWKLLVRWAKLTGDSYEVIDVNQSIVFDFKEQLKNKNWVKNTDNQKVTWARIKEVHVVGYQSNKLLYKYDLTYDYMTLVLRKVTRNYSNPNLREAYTNPLPISQDKYKDLNSLCNSGTIPNKYHNFFRSLSYGRSILDNDIESE